MPADHSTPEAWRCPECLRALSASRVCWTEGCPNEAAYIREDDTVSRGVIAPTPAPVGGERDWTEDFAHENGNYSGTCIHCGLTFIGHKRRVACRKCATPTSAEGGEAERCPTCGGTQERPYFFSVTGRRCGSAFHIPTLAATGGEERPDPAEVENALAIATGGRDIPAAFWSMHKRPTLALADEVQWLRRQLAEAEKRIAYLKDERTGTGYWWSQAMIAREAATTAERRLEEWQEEEAACCPEDVGFREYIASLEKRNTASQQEVARLTEELRAKAAAHERTYQAWESERAEKDRTIARLREALAFAASCIKSGESWTPTCAEIIGGALSSPHQSTGQGGGG